MSEKTCKKIRLIYGIFLSALLIVTGILLILSCVSIYKNGGDRPFTEQSISEAFNKIRAVIFITLGSVAAGLILDLCLKKSNGKKRNEINKKMILARLEKKADLSLLDEEKANKIKSLKNLRIAYLAAFSSISIALTIPTAIHVLNFANYSLQSYNASVKAMCIWIIPCFLIIAALSVIFTIIDGSITDLQISLLKQAIASGATKTSTVAEEKSSFDKLASLLILCARIIIPVVAIFFIIEGITQGGASEVLRKAINICTECIGLG